MEWSPLHSACYLLFLLLSLTYPGRLMQKSASQCNLAAKKSVFEYKYYQEGDIIIGGLFSAHASTATHTFVDGMAIFHIICAHIDVEEYRSILALIFAIDEINKNPDLLPNVTLGYHIYNTCGDPKKASDYVLQILSGEKKEAPNYSCMEHGEVAGFVSDSGYYTSHAMAQLLSLYRYPQVSTLDGVLELRNEHFWTLGFGTMAGSLHVRIRRDANEQLVLAHVTNRLGTLVSTLTVQIFKDEWARPVLSSGPLPPNMMKIPEHQIIQMPTMKTPNDEFSPMTSTPSKPSSPPPEFAFNTPGKNINPVILSNTQTRPYGLGLHYGSMPYGAMFNQEHGVPGIANTQGLRTGLTNVANRYGTYTPGGQFTQFKQ